MEHLREIDGDNKSVNTSESRVRLDEKEVSRADIEKAQENQGIRIVETEPNEFKTLHRIRG
jgi:hypothetical protein